MYDLGLNRQAYEWYLNALTSSHTLSMLIQVTDLEHNVISNVSNRLIDGQVTVDNDGQEATRELSISLFDPNVDLGFDTSDVVDGVWFFDRMLAVHAEVFVPELGVVVSCPIFTGPIRKFNRLGPTVTMRCLGKDVFARQSWPRLTIRAGTKRIAAIKQILRSLGETKFRFEVSDSATSPIFARDKIIDRSMSMTPWAYCRLLAAGIGCRLFYAGDGYAVLRLKDPDTAVFTFRDGDGGSILERPETDGDYSRIANVVRAEGVSDGTTSIPFYEAVVPSTSALSPTKLVRGGRPFYMGVVVQRDSIDTNAEAKTVAQAELKDRQRAAYATAYDAMPIWPLEEDDTVNVSVGSVQSIAPLTKFTLGFKPSAVMPIGYTKLVAPQVAKIRRF